VKTHRKRHATDAPFVEYRAECGRRIGMCGYRSVLLTYLFLFNFYIFSLVSVTWLALQKNTK